MNDAAVWYGAFSDDRLGSSSVSLTENVAVPISPNRTNLSYTFVTEAGRAVSYNDFNEFRLFTATNKMLLAKASIPNSPIKAPTTTVGNNPTRTTVQTNPPKTAVASQKPIGSSTGRSKSGPWIMIALLFAYIFVV